MAKVWNESIRNALKSVAVCLGWRWFSYPFFSLSLSLNIIHSLLCRFFRSLPLLTVLLLALALQFVFSVFILSYVSHSFTSVLTYFYPHAELIITVFVATPCYNRRLIFSTWLFHGISIFCCVLYLAHYANTMNANFMNEQKQLAHIKKRQWNESEWHSGCGTTVTTSVDRKSEPRSKDKKKEEAARKNNFPNKRKSNLFLPGKWTRKTVKGNIKSVYDANESLSLSLRPSMLIHCST